jgi:hypothetical protein
MGEKKSIAPGYGFGEALRQARIQLLSDVSKRTVSTAFRELLKAEALALQALPPLCDDDCLSRIEYEALITSIKTRFNAEYTG